MNYWILKTEPEAYSWNDLEAEGTGRWDGVRNYQARNHLQAMREGDLVLIYHSVSDREIIGIAKVVKEAYPDPTTEDPRWVAVDISPVEKLPKTVTLAQLKTDNRLANIAMLRQSRLSVSPLSPEEYDVILQLGNEG
ncbi:MAG: EVE domain-containing protein [Bacteroidia bacterium]|nr:EVE domain-containing protein [Bacteroidia bacterium]